MQFTESVIHAFSHFQNQKTIERMSRITFILVTMVLFQIVLSPQEYEKYHLTETLFSSCIVIWNLNLMLDNNRA